MSNDVIAKKLIMTRMEFEPTSLSRSPPPPHIMATTLKEFFFEHRLTSSI
jgi:hypothetical protein